MSGAIVLHVVNATSYERSGTSLGWPTFALNPPRPTVFSGDFVASSDVGYADGARQAGALVRAGVWAYVVTETVEEIANLVDARRLDPPAPSPSTSP